jgi:iron complex transport system permease protein
VTHVGAESPPAGASNRLWLAAAALVLAAAAALLFGRYPKPGFMDLRGLADDPVALRVLLLIRAPRVLAALLLGATLGAARCAFQLIFANPLVDAGFLGVSQGASLGAALALVAGSSGAALFGAAFAGALAALGLSVFLAGRLRFGGSVLRLVLAGIAVSAFFSAAVALVKYGADPRNELPDISYWMMGGLSRSSWEQLGLAAGPALVALAALVAARWRITLLSLDEATAASLGARPGLERALALGLAAAGVAAVTAMAGTVSWIGIIVPHAARLILRSEGAATIPGSALLGAAFAVVADAVARGLFAGELPLGVVTALLGTAVFVALLASQRLRLGRG